MPDNENENLLKTQELEDSVSIDNLTQSPDLDGDDVIVMVHENNGVKSTYKAILRSIANFINKLLHYSTDLHTQNDTIIGAINELADGGGGSADIISEASGTIVTINDGGDNIPVKSLVTEITAQQAGTGTPAPDNIRAITGVDEVDVVVCGKNFNQITETTGSHNGITYTFNDDGTISASGSVPSGNSYKNVGHFILQAGTYTISGLPSSLVDEARKCAMVLCKDAYSGSVNIIKTIFSNVALSDQFTLTEATDCYLRIYVYSAAGAISDVIFAPQIELGTSATSFEKFKGTTHTITLPETIYGGNASLTEGTVVKTHENIASYNGETINEPWLCSEAPFVSGTTPPTGSQVVYPFDTPTAISFTPERITTLSGLNNIYSNTGDVEVEYFNESANQTSELIDVKQEYANYSSEEKVVGKWLDGSTLYEKTLYFNNKLLERADSTSELLHGVKNIGSVKFVYEAYTDFDGGQNWQPSNNTLWINNWFYMHWYVGDTSIYIKATDFISASTNRSYLMKIRYTKA